MRSDHAQPAYCASHPGLALSYPRTLRDCRNCAGLCGIRNQLSASTVINGPALSNHQNGPTSGEPSVGTAISDYASTTGEPVGARRARGRRHRATSISARGSKFQLRYRLRHLRLVLRHSGVRRSTNDGQLSGLVFGHPRMRQPQRGEMAHAYEGNLQRSSSTAVVGSQLSCMVQA